MSTKPSIKLVDENELVEVIDQLTTLDDRHKCFLKRRWLKYVLWWDKRARGARWKYYTLRVTAGIGGVIVAALVAVNTNGALSSNEALSPFVKWSPFFVGLLISISIALEEIFHFGDIWREKRDAAEVLKVEGWRFFQLSGEYEGKSHGDAYPGFAARMETLIESEIKNYIKAVQEQKRDVDQDK